MDQTDTQLGRVLCAQRTTAATSVAALIIGGLLVAPVVLMVALGATAHLAIIAFAVGALLGLVFLWLGISGLISGGDRTTFHERGIVHETRKNETKFLCGEAEGVGYSVGDMMGEPMHMLTLSSPDGQRIALVASGSGKRAGQPFRPTTAEVEKVRDVAVRAVAQKWGQRLAAGEQVPWTDALALCRAGVVANGQLLPWESITDVIEDQGRGVFGICVDGRQTPVVSAKMTADGFLPGWELFRELRATKGSSVSEETLFGQ